MIAIRKSLDDIKYSINRDILNQVFVANAYQWRNTPVSLDEQILINVIRPRVLVDANLVGGTEVIIPLDGIPGRLVGQFMTVYDVPKDRTQGRSIMSLSGISYLSASMLSAVPGFQVFDPCSVSPVLQAGQAVFDAMNSIPQVSTARVSLIGENIVLVQDSSPPIGHGFLMATLSNDENLANIQLRSIPQFTQLCVLACKAYIYTNYSVTLDRGYLSGGQELGKFKEIVESYADANEMYNEYLATKWRKVAHMNDSNKFTKFIRNMTGTYR